MSAGSVVIYVPPQDKTFVALPTHRVAYVPPQDKTFTVPPRR